MAVVSVVSALSLTPLAVVLDEYFIDFQSWIPGLPPEISNGLVPFVVLTAAVAGFYFLIKGRFRASKAEIVQTMFIFLLVAFVVLTVIGVWFRGAGMKLVLLGG
jgi:hypothetical protein